MSFRIQHKRSIIRNIAEYCFIFLIILNCRSMWSSMPRFSKLFNSFLLPLLAISVLMYMFSGREILSRKVYNYVAVCGMVLIYASLFLIIHSSGRSAFIKFIISILIIFLFCVLNKEYGGRFSILEKYENIILVLCAVSLLFWVMGSILNMLHPTGLVESTWTGKTGITKSVSSYYGIYFETQRISFLGIIRIIRNTGFFTEAPMCSLHYCLAFLVEFYLVEKKRVGRIIVLTLGVVSTFSTTGLLVIIGAYFIATVFKKTKSNILHLVRVAVIPFVILISINVCINLIVNKLTVGTSGSLRIDDFIAGYKAWLNAPFFGHGFSNTNALARYMNMSIRSAGNIGFSNSPMMILVYGGLYLIAPFIFVTALGILKLIKERIWNELFFYLFFLFMFAITVIPFQYLSILIFMLFFI